LKKIGTYARNLMIRLAEYLEKPCEVLPIPYWKYKSIDIPENMKIIHKKNYSDTYLSDYSDEVYFRLYNPLKYIKRLELERFQIDTAQMTDIDSIVDIINNSYEDISVDYEQIIGYTQTPVYNSNLWILVRDIGEGNIIGCGIADYDNEAQEGVLEWIQVLPSYRGQKIGQAIVWELLYRLKECANFVTVSGQLNNITNPERLYRKCGFTGDDIWHILRKEDF
jgi:GNAT superfamily N-acetyltransferase